MIKILLKNKYFFFTSLFVLLIISSLISFQNLSFALYFNQKYIDYSHSLTNFFNSKSNLFVNDLSTFPIWGYGLVHWLFDSSKLNILIFQQALNFYTIYLVDQFLRKNHSKCLIFWRGIVLLAFPYFFFHTQLWPKSIASSLIVISTLKLIYYMTTKQKYNLIFSGIGFGLLCNFRSDYLYFIFVIPIIMMIWELINKRKVTLFSISIIIIPLTTLLFLVPWGIYSYQKTQHFLLTSTNSGHTLFIGLGQLPNNKWGITPRDEDPKMDSILGSKFRERSYLSTRYNEDQYLKKVFFSFIKESPLEWLKKCSYNLRLILMDPFYVGNVGNFQLNGISNIKEIRALENAVYQFDTKGIFQIINNTTWKFSLFEIFQLIITSLTKIIGIILFVITILSGLYLFFFKRNWFLIKSTNFLLMTLILYQLSLLIFVFHMPVYNTTIYLIYLIIFSLMLDEIFFNPTINHNDKIRKYNVSKI